MEKKDKIEEMEEPPKFVEPKEEKELTYEEQTEKDFHKNPEEEEVEEWEW